MSVPASFPVRIALVGPVPPPAGGMARQTAQLAEKLTERGWQVTLIPVNGPYHPPWVGRIRGLRALVRLVGYLWCLWRVLGRVDLVHVMANSGWSWHLFAAPAVWVARLRHRPLVLHYRGGQAADFLRHSWRWVAPTLARVDRLWVPTPYLQRVFAEYGVKAELMPNLLDVARYHPRGDRVPSAEGPHLVVVRNLEPIYGIDTVIRAFAVLLRHWPQARLSIAGTGPERRRLDHLCERLGVAARVSFTGHLEPEAVVKLYQSADLMLNASRVDNTPNALLEALAAEVPVISTDAGGIPQLLEHERSGLLVPVDDVEGLARAACRALEDNGLRQHLVEGGRVVASYFDAPAILTRMEAGYRSLLRPPGQGIPQRQGVR